MKDPHCSDPRWSLRSLNKLTVYWTGGCAVLPSFVVLLNELGRTSTGRSVTHYCLGTLLNVAWHGTLEAPRIQIQPKLNGTCQQYYGWWSPAYVGRGSTLPGAMFERGSEGMKDVLKPAANSATRLLWAFVVDLGEFLLGSAFLAQDIIPWITELNGSERGYTELCVWYSTVYLIKLRFLCVRKRKCTTNWTWLPM